ncbi:sigma-70 family RNA polymerase sigma factor [Acidisoma sp. 7E03]
MSDQAFPFAPVLLGFSHPRWTWRAHGKEWLGRVTDQGSQPERETAAALLYRTAEGDAAAFRVLYEQQSPRLYALALRMTRQPPLASDALQDTFVQVWRQAARFDPQRGSAEAWLIGLLRFRAIDILRSRQREEPGYEPPESADPAPDPFEQVRASRDTAALYDCLGTLDEAQQRIIRLAFLDGLSHAELASRLSAPLGTVKSWIRRALIGLKRCLEP